MIKFNDRAASTLAIVAVIGSLSLATAAHSQTAIDPTVQKIDNMTPHEGGMSRVDDRIRTLHDELNVSDDQESQWRKVAHVIRQNETEIHNLVAARHENESANAIDDLKSYENIARAHEQGLKRLVPVFKSFYNTLTPDQKSAADDMFSRYEGRKDDNQADAASDSDNSK